MTTAVFDALHEALHELTAKQSAAVGYERERLGRITGRLMSAIEEYSTEYWELIDHKFQAVALVNLLKTWQLAAHTDDADLYQHAFDSTTVLTGQRASMALWLAEAYRVVQQMPPTADTRQSIMLLQHRIAMRSPK